MHQGEHRRAGRRRWRNVAAAVAAGAAVATASVVGVAGPAAAAGATLYVNPVGTSSTCTATGTGACPTLAQAITASQNGSYAGDDVTVEVAAGTYAEHDTVTVSSSNSLTIAGAGASSTTVTGSGTGTVFCIRGGTVTLSGLTITDGVASAPCDVNGGGGVDDQGNLILDADTLSHDSAPSGVGGGVWNDLAITTAVDSTFVDDSAVNGGAVFAWGTTTLVDDTLADDSATTAGGALATRAVGVAVTTVTYDTLADDSAPNGPGVDDVAASTTVENSLLDAAGCSSTVGDGGGNVESDDTCGFGAADVVDSATIALATSLAANGSAGPATLAVGQASSAVDAVPAAACAPTVATDQQPSVTVTSDERGAPRPGETGQSRCDAGAYELQFSETTTSCHSGTACSGTVAAPGQTVTVSGTKATGTSATVTLSVAPAALSCPSFSYLAPVATLADAGFSTGTVLKVTDTVADLPSKKGVEVCYQPVAAVPPPPTVLGKCHGAKAAPCLKSVAEAGGKAVVTLQVPPGDPRFHVGGLTPVVTSLKPTAVVKGKKLSIKGANLSEVTTVTVGQARATVVSRHPTKLVVLVPPGATSGTVVVTSTAGSARAPGTVTVT